MVKLQPVQKAPEPRESKSGSGMKTILILILLAAAGYGGWFYWTKYKNPPTEAAKTGAPAKPGAAAAAGEKPKLTTNNNVLARAAATLNKVKNFNSEGEKAADQIQTSTAQPATAQTAPSGGSVAASIPGAKPWSAIPGMPRLQAISYKDKDATALIDGKTVKVGDEIGGAKVLEIKKNSVRVQLGSDTHEVTIK